MYGYNTNPYAYMQQPNPYMQNQPYQFQQAQPNPVPQPPVQPQPQQQMAQPINQTQIPLAFVNGLVGAKTYIVFPNTTVYLRDSDSDTLFIKKSDSEGKCDIQAFSLKEIPLEKVGEKITDEIPTPQITNYATKDDVNEIKAVLASFDEKLNKLSFNNRNTYNKPFNKQFKGDNK